MAKSLKQKDKNGDTLLPARRDVRLETPLHVQLFIARLIREVYHGKLDERKGSRLTYMLNILLSSFELVDFEKRIQELERNIER